MAATLQDGSRRLATLCFSTLTLSASLSLYHSYPLAFPRLLSITLYLVALVFLFLILPLALVLLVSLLPSLLLFPRILRSGLVLADVIRFNER